MMKEAAEILFSTSVVMCAFIGAITFLWKKDRKIPLFDVGAICLAVTCLYIVYPVVMYLLSGLRWTELSDSRLLLMPATPQDVATFLWLPTVYFLALSMSYVIVRGPGMPGPEVPVEVQKTDWIVICVIAITALVYQLAIEHTYGVDLNPSNQAIAQKEFAGKLPLFVAQLTHNVIGIENLAKFGLVIAFVSVWKSKSARGILFFWLLIEVVLAIAAKGARTPTAMLFLVVALAYHRMVQPIKARWAAALGFVFLLCLLAYGFYRSFGFSTENIFSRATEFQLIMGTQMHVGRMMADGTIKNVPWQVYWSELIQLVPQQLLPFMKIDPSAWYAQQAGSTSGAGWMFGVVSQAYIGGGYIELAARGIGLGVVLAIVHRLAMRSANRFLSVVLYTWLAVWSYYTYRAATFYILVFVIYRVVPFVTAVLGLSLFNRAVTRRLVSPSQS